MIECWLPIPEFPAYAVSNLGRIKRLVDGIGKRNGSHAGRILQGAPDTDGYLTTVLCDGTRRKSFRIAGLVARAFVPNPNNLPEIDHVDTNKRNNRADNLEWVTEQENVIRAFETGMQKSGEDAPAAKLTEKQVNEIRSRYVLGPTGQHRKPGEPSQHDLAIEYGVGESTIHQIIHKKKWRFIHGQSH